MEFLLVFFCVCEFDGGDIVFGRYFEFEVVFDGIYEYYGVCNMCDFINGGEVCV